MLNLKRHLLSSMLGCSPARAGRLILHEALNFMAWRRSNCHHHPRRRERKMAIERLDKRAWQGYFDAMSKVLPGKQAEIEVNSLRIGAQLESDFVPLLGITYDHQSDLLEIVREVYIDHDGVNLNSVSVTDADGVQQVIRLRDPAMLPAPPTVTRH
jgi:hypothetical protein